MKYTKMPRKSNTHSLSRWLQYVSRLTQKTQV